MKQSLLFGGENRNLPLTFNDHYKRTSMNRRKFLSTSAGLPGVFAASRRDPGRACREIAADPQEFQANIIGPVLSVPTCYRKDLSLDIQGMRRMVELGISSGCGVVTLTAGNNQYDLLNYEEIKDLTRGDYRRRRSSCRHDRRDRKVGNGSGS